jgi:hypothetical protein
VDGAVDGVVVDGVVVDGVVVDGRVVELGAVPAGGAKNTLAVREPPTASAGTVLLAGMAGAVHPLPPDEPPDEPSGHSDQEVTRSARGSSSKARKKDSTFA